MVKLVAVVVLVSCLLMLPVMIDTFCGFKLGVGGGGGYRFGLKLKVNCFLVLAHLCDIFTWHEECSNNVRGIKMWGGGGAWGCFVACASTIPFNVICLCVLREGFSARHIEDTGTTGFILVSFVWASDCVFNITFTKQAVWRRRMVQ